MDNGGWIQTYTGRHFYPFDPKVEDVDIVDIAHALSNICRFTGHTSRFYSVAQHSLVVSTFSKPEDSLWGLLHDASEAYLCDIARPVKHLPEMAPYRAAEKRLMDVICEAFELPKEMPASVKAADEIALVSEADALGFNAQDWGAPYSNMRPEKNAVLSYSLGIKDGFLEEFYFLTRTYFKK